MIFDLGDGVRLRQKVYLEGVLTNATVSLRVTAPDGTTITPTITRTATGVYDAAYFTASQLRIWDYVWTVSGTVNDLVHGQFTVGVARPSYVELDTLRSHIGVQDTSRDALLDQALRAASRGIERCCNGRQFFADSVVSTREYRTRNRIERDYDGELFLVDDIADDTGLVVQIGRGTTWTAVTDYFAEPENALARGEPITGLRRDHSVWGYNRYGGSGGLRMRVTARWGWPSVPDEVVQATLIQAARLFLRKDSAEGVMGSAEWGVIRLSRIDPDVAALIEHFTLPGVG